MHALLRVARLIDALTERVGRAARWLILLTVLISAGNALARYAFNASSNAWLEIQWYMFAAMFLLAAGYTLKHDRHVRVDIFYGMLSTRGQVWLDVVGGTLFLLPAMTLMAWLAWPLFAESWRIGETSTNAGGLIRWPMKLVIPVGYALVSLQGISEIVKRIGYLRGEYNMDVHYEAPLQ